MPLSTDSSRIVHPKLLFFHSTNGGQRLFMFKGHKRTIKVQNGGLYEECSDGHSLNTAL